jgi:protein tyrosine phosphatase (PTP) superfamily phosphohydrolase (DUF442 family)
MNKDRKLRLLQKIFFFIIVLSLILFAFYHVFFSPRIDTVVEGRVYRSAQLSGDLLEKIIREKGIKAIINLRGKSNDSQWYADESEISEAYHVQLYDIGLSPHDLPEYNKLINILDILLKSEKPILIHCHRGIDRTGLVSALALAIEQDTSLPELKKQFSWRYWVLPFYRSTGPYFFSKYEQWLNKTQRIHSKNNLIYWINNEYFDGQGNHKFWIDHVNGKMFDKDKKIVISGNSKQILIEGWAFDSRTNLPVNNLYVIVDNRTQLKADFTYNRTDVAEFYGLGEKYYENFVVGWKVAFQRDTIPDGCHKISLKIVKSGSTSLDIPTENTFCIENTF